MDTMTWKEFDSAEFVLNHSQQISVVMGTSSVYGVLEETRLTSTHPFNIPKAGITLGYVQENLETGRLQPRVAWDQIYIRVL